MEDSSPEKVSFLMNELLNYIFELEYSRMPYHGDMLFVNKRHYRLVGSDWVVILINSSRESGDENNDMFGINSRLDKITTNKKQMEKQLTISLEEARQFLNIHRAEKRTTLTIFETAILAHINKTWTKEELEKEEGHTWEEAFSGDGWYINDDSQASECSSCLVREYNKNIFKTKEQAESALSFAQLSHIVARYNEGKSSKRQAYSIEYSHLVEGNLLVRTISYGSSLPHLVFLTEKDATTSMQKNRELWEKYWMVSSTHKSITDND